MTNPNSCRTRVTETTWLHFVVFVLAVCSVVGTAQGVVLNFDDLADRYILTGSNYAGLNWETGAPAIDGLNGVWGVGGSYTHSGARSIINSGGTPLIGITFPSPVDVSGAYFAKQGNVVPTNAVRVHEFLNGTEIGVTTWFSISSIPTWLDMHLSNQVDRIVVESEPVSSNAGAYNLDDLTFTYIPEPASMTMLGLAGAGLLARRRR